MDSVLKGISVISILLILIGYTHLYSYYSIFGIAIYDFISVSEIILSFTPTIFFILISSVGFFMGYISGYLATPNYDIQKDQHQSVSTIRLIFLRDIPFLRRLQMFFSLLLSRYVLFSLVIVLSSVFLLKAYYFDNNLLKLRLHLMVFLVIQFIYFSTEKYFVPKLNIVLAQFTRQSLALSQTIVFVVYFLLFIVVSNHFKAKTILTGNPYFFVILEGPVNIQSSDNLVYIGSTKEYHFFRYLDSDTNLIIKNSNVNQIKIKEIL